MEQYSHLTGLEDQVKIYEDKVKTLEGDIAELNENLSAAQSEMTNKDNLVKQHAKVAEEAVSGMLPDLILIQQNIRLLNKLSEGFST